MDGVAKTSLLVAAMRAAESQRDTKDRLFVDPFAALLAGDEGSDLLKKAIAESGEQPAIAIRTHFIDLKIDLAMKTGIRQIVILAAGMDARAYRLDFPNGTKIFELDQKDVLDYKQEKLAKLRPKCELKSLAIDLSADWHSPLKEAGFRSREASLWLIEGLLMYLDESQVFNLLHGINSLASSQDIMLLDILSKTLLEAPYMQKQLQFLKSIGAPWKFGENDPENFFKQYGWQAEATQPGEFAPARWPFPTAPRQVPNVPRSFLVQARKS